MTRAQAVGFVGVAASALTILSFLPQTIQSWRSRSTRDLAFGTLVLLVIQAGTWLAYGVLRAEMPIVVTNVTVCVLTFLILIAKVRHG